jgi:hypothetical protein
MNRGRVGSRWSRANAHDWQINSVGPDLFCRRDKLLARVDGDALDRLRRLLIGMTLVAHHAD